MKESEQYLQEKVEGWKLSHPEWVEKGEKQLKELRARISEYKKNLSDKVSSHL